MQGTSVHPDGSSTVVYRILIPRINAVGRVQIRIFGKDGSAFEVGRVAREAGRLQNESTTRCINGTRVAISVPPSGSLVVGEITIHEGRVAVLEVNGSASLAGTVVHEDTVGDDEGGFVGVKTRPDSPVVIAEVFARIAVFDGESIQGRTLGRHNDVIGIVVGIPLRADVSRKDRRVGDCVALSPEGLVARKPTVHLNVRGEEEGSRLNGTW